MPEPTDPRTDAALLADAVDRLRAENDGLRTAMRTRGLIEQAKGMLMERLSCTADEAFTRLAILSQDTNTKVVEVAAALLGTKAPPEPQGGAGERKACADAGVRPQVPMGSVVQPVPERVPDGTGALTADYAAAYHVASSLLDTAADGDDIARLLGRDTLGPLGVDAVAIALLEPDGALRLVGTYGVPAQRVSEWRRIPPRTGMPLSDAVHTGRPVHIADRDELTERYPHLRGATLMPGARISALPLVAPGGAIRGGLAVSWPEPADGGQGMVDAYLSALAELCGRALLRIGAARVSDGEAWFQALLDALLDPALVLTPLRDPTGGEVVDFRVDYANTATIDLAGRTGEDLLGRRMTELYPGMVISGIFRKLLEVQATGMPYEGTAEQFIEVVGGALHSSTMILRAARFLDGLLLNWRIQDEDERRTAQLAQVQRLARTGIWDYDVGSDELAWSPEVFDIVGRDPAEGVPRLAELVDAVDPRDLPGVLDTVRLLDEEQRAQTLEFRVRRPDARPCTVRVAAEPVSTPDGGSVVAVRGVVQDVTMSRRTQAALAEARGRLVEERERTAVEHRAVQMLQRALLTVPDSSDPGAMRFAARYVPAEKGAQVGGDWYDAATLPDGRTLVAIGDVSGHGLPAAAGMTQLRHALRGMAYSGAEPARILGWLNDMVCHQRPEYIATVICAHFDPDAGTLTWAQAGHLPPLRVRRGAPAVLDAPVGMVLGAIPGVDYGSDVVALEPGDIVLMYTDGLVEHRGDDLGRGLSRLMGVIREQAPTELRDCVAGVMRRLGGPNPQDDTCLIGFQIPGATAPDGG